MPNRCTICELPEVAELNAALRAGQTPSELAREWELPRQALVRHRDLHLPKIGRPTKQKRGETARALSDALLAGKTLREAAKAAGVHVSTVCRWQARDRDLRALLGEAARLGWHRRHPWPPARRPSVEWRHDCPLCGAAVVVRTGGLFRFWRCERWPKCGFSSWRPPAPGECPTCHGPLFWSHSRRTIRCDRCVRQVRQG